jgi:chemotaxis signal transduction protein
MKPETERIDWELVRLRMKDAEATLQRAFEPGTEEREAVLLRRAAALAEKKEAGRPNHENTQQLLLLRVGESVIGLDASQVSQIISFQHWAAVPDAHDALLGVVNVRSELVSLCSPYPYLKTTGGDVSEFVRGAVLRHPSLRLALGCHEVLGFVRLASEEIKENNLFEAAGRLGVLLDANVILEPFYSLVPA